MAISITKLFGQHAKNRAIVRRNLQEQAAPRNLNARLPVFPGVQFLPIGNPRQQKEANTMNDKSRDNAKEKPSVTLPGTVDKIIPATPPIEPEKAQISVDGGEDLYKEIRIENKLKDEDGNDVVLKPGAPVEVTIEADKAATTPKNSSKAAKSG
jgi:hypothetical protein